MNFPNDDDGDALRRVSENSDMSKPMDIDFTIDLATETDGIEVARLAAQRGYQAALEFDEDTARWTCYCTKQMLATYDGVLSAQRELNELSAAFGGHCDGWGTLGNS